MIVNSLIASVKKYFSTLSVDSLYGESKITLILANSDKTAEGNILEIDATESINLGISKSVIKHSAESSKVFFDGAKMNNNRMTIVGHIDSIKTSDLEKFSQVNAWMYVLYTKEMGGSIAEVGMYENSKLYHILSSNITDTGFNNTVKIQLEMEEVVLYKYKLSYKFGVKQTNPVSGNGKGGEVKQSESVISWFPETIVPR